MRQIFLSISFLLAAMILVGCEENQNETTDDASAEVTARLCHIARIGNLAEIPEDMWENENIPESIDLPGGIDYSGKMKEAPVAKAVGQDVKPDVLAIVESTAQESTSEEGLKKAQEKKKELDDAIEMVKESQETDSEVEEMFQNSGQEYEDFVGNDEENEDEEVDVSMGDDDDEETWAEETAQNVKTVAPDKKKSKKGQESNLGSDAEDEVYENEAEGEAEDEEGKETPEEAGGKTEAGADGEKPVGMNPGAFEDEVKRQAKEFLKVLQNTPKEVREDLKKAHFQNVTYRLVKVPGVFIQGVGEELMVVRTMEYTGTNLAYDYQMLNLSPSYSAWLLEQEKYLEIMYLDSQYHETWVEVPETWSSNEE